MSDNPNLIRIGNSMYIVIDRNVKIDGEWFNQESTVVIHNVLGDWTDVNSIGNLSNKENKYA